MKKIVSLLLLIVMCLALSGCWVYGKGSTVGYVTTVEDGIFWNTVWIRADTTSSQTNGYAIRKDRDDLRDALLQTSIKKQRVELNFKKHVGMARFSDNALSDEIVSFNILEPRP